MYFTARPPVSIKKWKQAEAVLEERKQAGARLSSASASAGANSVISVAVEVIIDTPQPWQQADVD